MHRYTNAHKNVFPASQQSRLLQQYKDDRSCSHHEHSVFLISSDVNDYNSEIVFTQLSRVLTFTIQGYLCYVICVISVLCYICVISVLYLCYVICTVHFLLYKVTFRQMYTLLSSI